MAFSFDDLPETQQRAFVEAIAEAVLDKLLKEAALSKERGDSPEADETAATK